MNRFALGTVQFGLDYGISNTHGQVASNEAHKILSTALKFGINTFDTAIAYGESENVLGTNLSQNNVNIITKISIKDCHNKSIKTLIESSLKRLKKKKLYAVLLHDPNELLSKYAEKNHSLLKTLKPNFCDKIGVSVYHPEQLIAIIENFDIDIVQIPVNIFDQRFLNKQLLQRLKEKNIEIHARSLFLQGLLLMNDVHRPENFNTFKTTFKQYDDFCTHNKISKLLACLSFAKANKEIDKFVVGACSNNELLEIIEGYKYAPKLSLTSFNRLHSTEQNLINPSIWPKNKTNKQN
jgi:hypothetical protein